MTTLLQRTEITKDFAQTSVENMVTTVQNVHNVITEACFNLLDQVTGGKNRLGTLKEKHDAAVKQVYDAIKSINRNLGNMASELFGTVEDSKIAAEVMTENDAKKAAKVQQPE